MQRLIITNVTNYTVKHPIFLRAPIFTNFASNIKS